MDWDDVMFEECFRLSAAPGGKDYELFTTTLREELFMLGHPESGFDGHAARQSREAYVYLRRHGYEAYWAWMAERDPDCGPPWAFSIEDTGEPPDRRQRYALEHVDAVLACLQALPDACGAARVWEALAAVPEVGEDV